MELQHIQVQHVVLVLAIFVVIMLTAFWWVVSRLGHTLMTHLDYRFKALADQRTEDRNYLTERFTATERAQRLQAETIGQQARALEDLRASLPREYWRREDAIRHEVTLNAKLDAIAARLPYLGDRDV